jgi:hypothetical protein
LTVKQSLSHENEEYFVDIRASVAARELIEEGVNIRPGEKVDHIIVNAKAKIKPTASAQPIGWSNEL